MKDKKLIRESIFRPYLIHVEYEVFNILTQIKTNKTLRKVIESKGYSVSLFEKDTKYFIERIQDLNNILKNI